MSPFIYSLTAEVWVYQGQAAWHFITLPQQEAQEIKELFGIKNTGWGAIPVLVTLGKTSWKTSIFRDGKRNSYLLPIKKEVRIKEEVAGGDTVKFVLEILQ